jgi:PhzF family phenazine biosynthesis protein
VRLKQYQVDAFARRIFTGNPAAVCPLNAWLDDKVLQALAEENNLSETAFFVPTPGGFHLRWFTPVAEVDLCGHATLASAHVIFEILGYPEQVIQFETRSGTLAVERRGGLLSMSFPSMPPKPCPPPPALIEGLGRNPVEILAAQDYIAVFETEAVIRSISPELTKLKELGLRGVSVTAPGSSVDFVSRFFAPKFGIPEDPVTGSVHCTLAPYWASKLGKATLTAQQVSKRGGDILCEVNGGRVVLLGSAITFMVAEIDMSQAT